MPYVCSVLAAESVVSSKRRGMLLPCPVNDPAYAESVASVSCLTTLPTVSSASTVTYCFGPLSNSTQIFMPIEAFRVNPCSSSPAP